MTSDQNGDYALPELAPGGSYTVIPVSADFLFSPQSATFHDLSANKVRISQADRVGTRSAGESRQLTAQDWVACVTLLELPATCATTDASGNYVLPEVAADGDYTVVPVSPDFLFTPTTKSFQNLTE